jgi:hypothetical protein
MRSRANIIKAIFVAWLLWAWVEYVPALVAGANFFGAASVALLVYSAVVVGLLFDARLAWLAAPLPAFLVAGFGIPWFVNSLGSALGFDRYHDSPGVTITLLVGLVLPLPALVALVLLWLERRKVFGLFRRAAVPV